MEYAIVQLLVFLLIAGVDIGTAVYNRYVLDLDSSVGYVAHLAGAMAGESSELLFILCVLRLCIKQRNCLHLSILYINTNYG